MILHFIKKKVVGAFYKEHMQPPGSYKVPVQLSRCWVFKNQQVAVPDELSLQKEILVV